MPLFNDITSFEYSYVYPLNFYFAIFFFACRIDVHATACWRIGSYAPEKLKKVRLFIYHSTLDIYGIYSKNDILGSALYIHCTCIVVNFYVIRLFGNHTTCHYFLCSWYNFGPHFPNDSVWVICWGMEYH